MSVIGFLKICVRLQKSKQCHSVSMLNVKRVYSDIVAATGASTATISRVNRSLIYGCDAYDMIFERMEQEKKEK